MTRSVLATVVMAASLSVVACGDTRSAAEAERANVEAEAKKAAEERAAEERERSEEANELERRASNLESRWTEMQTTMAARSRTATAALYKEVAEDVKNAREAVADLRTTTADNWWERHVRAIEQSVSDVQADVQRLSNQKVVPEPVEPVDATGAFDVRRDAFVNRVKARVDAMEEQLSKVKARGARETELDDTKQRIDKLQDDLGELGGASADSWWDVSTERVGEYIDRVEASIKRLDDNKAPAASRD